MEFTKDIEFNHSPTANQELTITYRGFLASSETLSIVYGFGEAWKHTTETSMMKTENGFMVKINLLDFDTFNFCFKNANNEWDNNYHFNFVCSISPSTSSQTTTDQFDINALIEEILEPINFKTTESSTIEISSKPIDLGEEVGHILSEISTETIPQETKIYSTLDEILSGTVIEEKTIDLFETQTSSKTNIETALIKKEDPFMISARKLSKFYLLRKRIRLSLYKLFIKLPTLIFGPEEQ